MRRITHQKHNITPIMISHIIKGIRTITHETENITPMSKNEARDIIKLITKIPSVFPKGSIIIIIIIKKYKKKTW